MLLVAGAYLATLGQTLLPKLEPPFRWQAIVYTALGLRERLPGVVVLVPGDTGEDIVQPLTATPAFALSGRTTSIVLPERASELDYIRQRFPDGTQKIVNSRAGVPLFYAYDVSGP